MKGHVARNQEIPFQDLGGGVQRRVLSYNEELMTVEVAFQAAPSVQFIPIPIRSAPMCCPAVSAIALRRRA